MDVKDIIEKLELIPLPIEGGMYKQTYVGETTPDERPAGTVIYYLLSGEAFSHLHLLDADEVYHFYLGDPVELYQLDDKGNMSMTILGQDIMNGQKLQENVSKGIWQGSRLVPGGKWTLLGTSMSPGYTDSGYTHGHREELISRFPQHEEIIRFITDTNH